MDPNPTSLRHLILRGSAWTMLSIGSGQIMRLGKSLILTRLLFPEAYGVMAIVWSILYTLAMLSDAGLSAAAVRHHRGSDPLFLNTIWIMKIVRGLFLFGVTCAIAYPISQFYSNKDLLWLVPASGLTVLIEGFGSTKLYALQRAMEYKQITILELLSESVGFVATLVWAYLSPGVGALMGGALVVAVTNMVGTHTLLPGSKNQLQWDKTAFKEIVSYGKWVFFSSIIFLIYTQGDRIILGKLFDPAMLGIYSVAILLSESVSRFTTKLNSNVLFPALSKVINSDRSRLKTVFYKTRLGTDIAIVIPVSMLIVLGNDIVSLLYDHRYQSAGWMLQVLSVRLLMMALLASSEMCLLALGQSIYSLILNSVRAAWILIGIPIAWHFFGVAGVLWTVSLTEAPVVFILWYGMMKNNLLSIKTETRSLLFILLGIVLGLGMQYCIDRIRSIYSGLI